MFKLDKKDKKILYELFKDGRAPLSKIAKASKISKESVHYRLNRLKKSGFLRKVIPVINPIKLGFDLYIAYFKLQKLSEKKEKEIIEFFNNHESTITVITCTGNWDVLIEFYARDIEDYYNIMNSFTSFLGENLNDYRTETELRVYTESHGYLFKDIPLKRIEIKRDIISKKIKIDKKDIEILKLLESDGRLALTTIAKRTGLSADTVSYRLKRMIKEGVIESFRPVLDASLLSYDWYIINLLLYNTTDKRKNELINYLRDNPNVFFMAKSVEPNQLEFELMAKGTKEFRKILMKVRNLFGDIIKNYESLLAFEEHKYTHIPKIFFKS
jgi:DNA-binding Lrp family transcriptional regulator